MQPGYNQTTSQIKYLNTALLKAFQNNSVQVLNNNIAFPYRILMFYCQVIVLFGRFVYTVSKFLNFSAIISLHYDNTIICTPNIIL